MQGARWKGGLLYMMSFKITRTYLLYIIEYERYDNIYRIHARRQ